LNLRGSWAKYEAVVGLNYENTVTMKEKAWINCTLFEAMFDEAIMQVDKPATCCLFYFHIGSF